MLHKVAKAFYRSGVSGIFLSGTLPRYLYESPSSKMQES